MTELQIRVSKRRSRWSAGRRIIRSFSGRAYSRCGQHGKRAADQKFSPSHHAAPRLEDYVTIVLRQGFRYVRFVRDDEVRSPFRKLTLRALKRRWLWEGATAGLNPLSTFKAVRELQLFGHEYSSRSGRIAGNFSKHVPSVMFIEGRRLEADGIKDSCLTTAETRLIFCGCKQLATQSLPPASFRQVKHINKHQT